MNELIEKTFKNYSVPIAYLFYNGSEETYIVYSFVNSDGVLCADNNIIAYADYYDFDIYSKGNYLEIAEDVKKMLENAGFLWQPSRSSADLYETDTKYYHKTLCFSIERNT